MIHSTIHKSTVNIIRDEADIKPHKITYYCENRDLDFDESGKLITFEDTPIYVLSYDKKPRIQAIATTSDDLMPDEKHLTINRDYEYKRLGILSLFLL
nr:hypothetical protein [Roseburia sp.]